MHRVFGDADDDAPMKEDKKASGDYKKAVCLLTRTCTA